MIANLAVTDLLVGAVSMPFSTGVDAFILRGTASQSTIFVLNEIGISVLITLFSTSYHLLLLSLGKVGGDSEMDRVQSFNHKRTLKKYTVIAWMDSVTKVALYQALVFAEVPHEVLFVVDLAINLSWLTETLTLL